MHNDLTLRVAGIVYQEATLTSRVGYQTINFAQPNNTEAVLRDVLDWRRALRQAAGNELSSIQCHRLHDEMPNVVLAINYAHLEITEAGIKKGLKVH